MQGVGTQADPAMTAPKSIEVDGHQYVHVAACPCPEMRIAMAGHAADFAPRTIGYTASECERDMAKVGRHCADPEVHAVV